MAHTFTNLLTHVIFSIKDREPAILPEFKRELWAYMGGIVRELDGKALMIGGTRDHVHFLPPLRGSIDYPFRCAHDLRRGLISCGAPGWEGMRML